MQKVCLAIIFINSILSKFWQTELVKAVYYTITFPSALTTSLVNVWASEKQYFQKKFVDLLVTCSLL